jgi:hypothetical protein
MRPRYGRECDDYQKMIMLIIKIDLFGIIDLFYEYNARGLSSRLIFLGQWAMIL